MTPLSTRAEQAKPEEARGLLKDLSLFDPRALEWSFEQNRQFDTLLDINTPEAHLAAAMMLGGDELSLRMSEAYWLVCRELELHCRIAKPEDKYVWKLARALIAAIAKAQEAGQ